MQVEEKSRELASSIAGARDAKSRPYDLIEAGQQIHRRMLEAWGGDPSDPYDNLYDKACNIVKPIAQALSRLDWPHPTPTNADDRILDVSSFDLFWPTKRLRDLSRFLNTLDRFDLAQGKAPRVRKL